MPACRECLILALLADVDAWETFRASTGTTLYRIPGSGGVSYVVGPASCTCPADQYRHRDDPVCKHREAVSMYQRIVRAHRRAEPGPQSKETRP